LLTSKNLGVLWSSETYSGVNTLKLIIIRPKRCSMKKIKNHGILYKYNVSTAYIPKVLAKMGMGGKSRPESIRIIRNLIENYRAWKVNGLKYPITLLLKPLSKIPQFLFKKKV
jgi:hypothetical protein